MVFRYKLRNDGDNRLLAALHETEKEEDRPEIPTLEEIGRTADNEKDKWKRRYDLRHRKPKAGI